MKKKLEKHSKALKSPWILPFIVGFNTVFLDLNRYKIVVHLFGAAYQFYHLQEDSTLLFGGLNQYKIVVSLFGAAYAAPNKGTIILH